MKTNSTLKGKANGFLAHTKNENGITVLTIIIVIAVLMIIVGVTIFLTVENNRIFSQTKEEVKKDNTKIENDIIGVIDNEISKSDFKYDFSNPVIILDGKEFDPFLVTWKELYETLKGSSELYEVKESEMLQEENVHKKNPEEYDFGPGHDCYFEASFRGKNGYFRAQRFFEKTSENYSLPKLSETTFDMFVITNLSTTPPKNTSINGISIPTTLRTIKKVLGEPTNIEIEATPGFDNIIYNLNTSKGIIEYRIGYSTKEYESNGDNAKISFIQLNIIRDN